MDIPRDFVHSPTPGEPEPAQRRPYWENRLARRQKAQPELLAPDPPLPEEEPFELTDDPTVLRRFCVALLASAANEVKQFARSEDPEERRLARQSLNFLCHGHTGIEFPDAFHHLADMEGLLECDPAQAQEQIIQHFQRFRSLAGLHKKGASPQGQKRWNREARRRVEKKEEEIAEARSPIGKPREEVELPDLVLF